MKYVATFPYKKNESIAGADASVEVPKLHNIKLLIASFIHTLIIIIMMNFAAQTHTSIHTHQSLYPCCALHTHGVIIQIRVS